MKKLFRVGILGLKMGQRWAESVVKHCEAALESARIGKPVKIKTI